MNRGFAVVIVAIALLGGLWCYFNFERVSERQFVGFSGEAARNPFLAFERLVKRMGVEASRVTKNSDFDRLPPHGTLVVSARRYGMTRARVKTLTDWASAGGHLIVEAEKTEERDPLLDALGVARREAPGYRSCPSDVSVRVPGRSEPLRSCPSEVSVRLPGQSEPFRVNVPVVGFDYSGGAEGFVEPPGRGHVLLHTRIGSGQVTVLSSLDFMRNAGIGEHDHAAFAWGIIRLMPDTVGVVIAARLQRLSLAEWFRENALGASLAAATLLALWLWRVGRRFGPIAPPHEPRRRRLLDHLRASGHFQWSAGAAPTLITAAREACLANIARRRPGVVDMPPAERSIRLSELTRIPAEEIEHALAGEATTQRAFTAALSTLQQIEDRLTHVTA